MPLNQHRPVGPGDTLTQVAALEVPLTDTALTATPIGTAVLARTIRDAGALTIVAAQTGVAKATGTATPIVTADTIVAVWCAARHFAAAAGHGCIIAGPSLFG